MRRYLLIISIFSMSFMTAGYVADILQQLQIAEDEARSYIFDNFEQGGLGFPYSSVLKSVALGDRAKAVNQLGDYIRKYTESPEFIKTYNEHREAAKPQGPGNDQEKLQKKLEEINHDIKTAEEDMKSASGDMKKLYEATIKMLKEQQKALKDPNDPNHKMFLQDVTGRGGMDDSYYQQAQKDFEENYPATAKDLVKKRLREFLAMTADIDFNAKLVGAGKIKKFADPKLEAKDGDWKRCFRAGKETMTAARAYAQKWLNELK